MIPSLLSILFLIQAAEPTPWKVLPADEDGTAAYRLLDQNEAGDTRRLVMRVTPSQPRDWTTGELVYELSCRARTITILSVRSLDAEGVEMQFVAVPDDRRRAEPMYAEPGMTSTLYSDLCPQGAPLDVRPPLPQIVPTPRR
ncbi:MAG: hypothetical protein HYU62_08650 [Caulobacterales bacterium]|nr:hypothetical protein [Caulobacterales bacterium]